MPFYAPEGNQFSDNCQLDMRTNLFAISAIVYSQLYQYKTATSKLYITN
jgi:hypothetical protein